MSESDIGPLIRPRRLRTTPAMRRMVAETAVQPGQLVLPVFVREGIDAPVPITSMPGVVQHTRSTLLKAVTEAAAAKGWIDREPAILESLTSIRRAGADVILTYWATEAARLLSQ